MRYFKTTLMRKEIYNSPFKIVYFVAMPDRGEPVLADPEFVRAPKDAQSLAPVFIPGEISGDRFVFAPRIFPINPEIRDSPSNTEGFPIVDEKTCEAECLAFSETHAGDRWLNEMLREDLARRCECKVDEISDDTVEKIALRIREIRGDDLVCDESHQLQKSKKSAPSHWQTNMIFQVRDDESGKWWYEWDYEKTYDIACKSMELVDAYADELDNGRMTPAEVRKAIVQKFPLAVILVRNPDEELCEIALTRTRYSHNFIRGFLQSYCYKNNSSAKSKLLEELENLKDNINGLALQYVTYPTEELCVAAVLQNPAAMWFVSDRHADAAKKALAESRGEKLKCPTSLKSGSRAKRRMSFS